MKIRNKHTGQVFEVVAGTLYPSFFEEVKDEDIKVGEPTVEFEIEEEPEPVPEPKPKKKTTRKTTKKGAKKNDNTK